MVMVKASQSTLFFRSRFILSPLSGGKRKTEHRKKIDITPKRKKKKKK